MSRTPAASPLLALAVAALCLGVAGGVAATDGPRAMEGQATEVVEVTNTTNYLFPPAESATREAFVRGDVDVGGAVAVSTERLRGSHEQLTLEARLSARELSASERLAVVERAVDRSDRRLARLDEAQADLYESYANGAVSGETFVRRLAVIDAKAAQSEGLVSSIQSGEVDVALPSRLETRLAELQAELVALPGPIDAAIERAITGAEEPVVVYTRGTADGAVLATVRDGEFLRQTTLRSEYAPDEPNQFEQEPGQPITLAFQRAAELYPWVFENALGNQRISGYGDSGVYRVDASHPHGELRSYIHGGTTNVFREEHRQQPEMVPVRLTAENATGDLTLSIEAGTETGPMRISATQNGIGTDATVAVDGTVVGATGADGELWTVRPSGQFRVNATIGDERVALSP